VDDWPIAPSVYLSILATLSGICLRSAFQEGAETYWWSLLLSDSGVKLQTLHSVWELKHDALSRFKITRHDPEPVLRTAGIILLLMAANGPLLQQAVVVDLVPQPILVDKDIPIRREPMWNLTAQYYEGLTPAPAAYQDEFARVAIGLSQRQPMRLSSSVCPSGATCRASVTVAGFSRACKKGSISIVDQRVPVIAEFQSFPGTEFLRKCEEVGGDAGYSCDHYPIDFQLQATLDRDRQESVENGTGPEELPWPASDLVPAAINYTNYFREDTASDFLTIQRCNFTSAWVNLSIEITEENVVRLEQLLEPELSIRNRGIEAIPSATSKDYTRQVPMLAGVEQTMQEQYAGFSAYDGTEYQHGIQGLGPRQFINQTNVKPILEQGTVRGHGFRLSFRDPLESFTDTLHELSLRYALETMISTPRRTEELLKYFNNSREGSLHRRERALQAMKTKPSKIQRVTVRQTSIVAIYRTNSLFAFIAVGISTAVSVLVALLLTGWRRCGRSFSMSPLEIAKAFDAPLLRQVGSNMPASQIAKNHGGSRLKYGEVKLKRRNSATNSDSEPFASQDADCETAPRAEDDGLIEPTGARLAIDVADRVLTPVKGKIYV
jgi:hypothetical protein